MQKETSAHYLESVNRATEFIEAHAAQNISLEAIAEYALLSKFHFHRVFKAIVGHTAKGYLTRLRLEKSAMLLKNTDKTIGQIAYDCGYGAPETFARAFRGFFGTTPTLFRENAKNTVVGIRAFYHNSPPKGLVVGPPKIIEKASLGLAYIRQYGSYEKIDDAFGRLMAWDRKNRTNGPEPAAVGIVHDNPALTAESNLRFDACLVIPDTVRPQGEIGYKEVAGGKFATFRYHGPFEDFYAVYDYIYNVCLFEKQWALRDEPALEWYISPPPYCHANGLVTDFFLPIV